jgi:hypothetical protein
MPYVTYSHHLNILVSNALTLAEKHDKGLWIYKAVNGEWYELFDRPIKGKKSLIHIPNFCLFSRVLSSTERAIINKAMRLIDDSHLWPINGEFNVTERAIRRMNKYERDSGEFDCAYSYWKSLENEISNIVNDWSR